MVQERDQNPAADAIRRLIHRVPFVSFRIVMTSGDRCLIEDPDALAIGGSQLHYFAPRSDRAIHMRLNQIAAIEDLGE
jgi:hypothetical protein